MHPQAMPHLHTTPALPVNIKAWLAKPAATAVPPDTIRQVPDKPAVIRSVVPAHIPRDMRRRAQLAPLAHIVQTGPAPHTQHVPTATIAPIRKALRPRFARLGITAMARV